MTQPKSREDSSRCSFLVSPKIIPDLEWDPSCRLTLASYNHIPSAQNPLNIILVRWCGYQVGISLTPLSGWGDGSRKNSLRLGKKTCCMEDNSGSQSLLRRIGKKQPVTGKHDSKRGLVIVGARIQKWWKLRLRPSHYWCHDRCSQTTASAGRVALADDGWRRLVQLCWKPRQRRRNYWAGSTDKSRAAAGRATSPSAGLASSALRRRTARARYRRTVTQSSWRSWAWHAAASSPSRAAAARARSRRVWDAVADQAPVLSTTKGWKRAPWRSQSWPVWRWPALTSV